MTSQAISGNFAKVSNFTELKNFAIALRVFMVVDSQDLKCIAFEFHDVPLT